MKRAVQLALLTLILGMSAFLLSPTPALAANDQVPNGLEGGGMSMSGVYDTTMVFKIMGACAEGSAPTQTGNSDGSYIDDAFQGVTRIPPLYFAKGCPDSLTYGHSTLAGLSNVTLALFNSPIKTSDFAIDLGQTLGFIPKTVNAQGIGFSGLNVLLPIWKAFRNVAYAMLAVILIIIGFMVMFRKKIDPKTVVTVQNAIPRVVIALLLVTFSYAIVGVMIDLMYFTIVLAASIIVTAAGPNGSLGALVSGVNATWYPNLLNPSTWLPSLTNKAASTTDVINLLLNGGIWGTLRFFFGSGFQAFDDIGKLLLGSVGITNATQATALFAVQGILTFLIGGGGKSSAIVAGLTNGPVLLLLIILIILLFGIIRLVFMLVDAYINIIISLLFSPFQLMLEAIPGTNSFSSWFRWLLAKVITFPVTAVLMMIAAFLTSQSNATKLWAPPLLSSGGGTTGMAGFIGLGMLMVIPNVVASIQKALKAEPFIPGGVGAVIGPLGSGVGQLMQIGYQGSFIASAIRHKPDARSPSQTIREASQKGFGAISSPGGEGH